MTVPTMSQFASVEECLEAREKYYKDSRDKLLKAMYMSEHTKEPWKLNKGRCFTGYTDAFDREKSVILEDVAGEIARRIVACVNACGGIETEALEEMRGNSVVQTAARVMNIELIEQRDKLLEVLKSYKQHNYYSEESFTNEEHEAMDARVDSIIAEIEAGK